MFQELLDEFARRRMQVLSGDRTRMLLDVHDERLSNLEWAVQSILEKLRDGEAK